MVNIKSLAELNIDEMVVIIDECRLLNNLDAELAWNRHSLLDSLKNGKSLGVYAGDELLGFIVYTEFLGSCSLGAEVWCLATKPRFQGRGIMTSLLKGLQTQFAEIWLEVHEANSLALKFYKDKGFQQVGLRKRYYKDGKDALLLSWSSKKP